MISIVGIFDLGCFNSSTMHLSYVFNILMQYAYIYVGNKKTFYKKSHTKSSAYQI